MLCQGQETAHRRNGTSTQVRGDFGVYGLDLGFGTSPPNEADFLMGFMVFPDLQTLGGYANLIRAAGLKLKEQEDLSVDFAQNMDQYLVTLKKNKGNIIAGFGNDLYNEAEKGIIAWNNAAHEKKLEEDSGLQLKHESVGPNLAEQNMDQ